MKPYEQARVQRRIEAWASSPQERQAARERYKKMEKLPADKKQGLNSNGGVQPVARAGAAQAR